MAAALPLPLIYVPSPTPLPLRRSMAVSSRSPDLPPTASTSLPFSPSLSSPATNAFAATSLVRSHGSAPAAMDEFCLQRVVGTDHRAALEGSGRGSPPLLRPEEAIDAPYFTPSQQQRAPPRPFVGTPCSAYFVDDVLQAVLPGKKMHIMGNLRVEKKNPIQVRWLRTWLAPTSSAAEGSDGQHSLDGDGATVAWRRRRLTAMCV
uniref:Uncharacterized protein n=1 Tax=Triticum urartu TaxID=4572 RepID=A0A8R7JZS2_TRIUA